MHETYHVGAYWAARSETAAECARRMRAFVTALAPVDPLFAHWFQSAQTLKQALQRPLDTELPALEKSIQRHIHRDDMRVPIEDLGFSVWLWNGGSGGDDVWFRSNIGGGSQELTNYCFIQTPNVGPHAERVLSVPILSQVLRAMVTAWDPDWAVATSGKHRDAVCPDDKMGTFVGWLTYLANRRGKVPPLPDPVRVEPVEDQGTLLVLTPERLTASNPEHVTLATRVMDLLGQARMLAPVRP